MPETDEALVERAGDDEAFRPGLDEGAVHVDGGSRDGSDQRGLSAPPAHGVRIVSVSRRLTTLRMYFNTT